MSEPPPPDLFEYVTELARMAPRSTLESVARQLMTEDVLSEQVTAALPNAALRARLQRILQAWFASSERTRSELGCALLAASHAGTHAASEVGLVWTGPVAPSTTLRETQQALIETITAATRELWLASFTAYRVPLVQEALVRAAERGVGLHLIAETPHASDGRLTFTELDRMGHSLGEQATVYVWPLGQRARDAAGHYGSLHVKCALADDRVLYVSSANLTDFAMTLNMELGVLLKDERLAGRVRDHFRWLREQRIIVPSPKR